MESSLESQATAALANCRSEIDSLLNDPEWSGMGSKNGVESWKKSTASGVNMIKAVGNIPAGPDQIADLIKDSKRKFEWDEMLKSTNHVAQFNDNFYILHEEFNTPWPTSNRDFVFAVRIEVEGDRTYIMARSIDSDIPPGSGVVRGEVYTSFLLLDRIPEGSTVTYIVNADPKGMIPHWIVNMIASKQGQNIYRMRTIFSK